MGAVYLGFDTSLNRPVALKTLRPELARDPSFLARFQREAQSQANLVHPHVVQVYFVGEERGVWFMAMQLVDGGSLQDAVDRQGPLPWTEVATHFVGLAEALVEAARMGIIHRDLKPANVLLDRYGIAHVADFGLVTATHAPSDHDTLVKSPLASVAGLSVAGSVMGTLPYMPPEQLRGQRLDQRADVYGLGRHRLPSAGRSAAGEGAHRRGGAAGDRGRRRPGAPGAARTCRGRWPPSSTAACSPTRRSASSRTRSSPGPCAAPRRSRRSRRRRWCVSSPARWTSCRRSPFSASASRRRPGPRRSGSPSGSRSASASSTPRPGSG